MLWSITKFALIGIALVAVLGALLTRKEFHVEIIIAAPPQAVWEVLMDTAAYPDWNPTFVEVVGTYTEGAKVLNRVRDPSAEILEMSATVTTLEKARELRQSGGIPGVLTFDHRWLLEATQEGTKVVQHEVDRGIGLWFWKSDWIEPAYAATNEALKQRVLSNAG